MPLHQAVHAPSSKRRQYPRPQHSRFVVKKATIVCGESCRRSALHPVVAGNFPFDSADHCLLAPSQRSLPSIDEAGIVRLLELLLEPYEVFELRDPMQLKFIGGCHVRFNERNGGHGKDNFAPCEHALRQETSPAQNAVVIWANEARMSESSSKSSDHPKPAATSPAPSTT